jgi:hypothetical protein
LRPSSFTFVAQAESLTVMIELMRTNDPVLISFVEALLRDAGVTFFVADQNMSMVEGSIGILQRRVLVADDELDEARELMADAGLADELKDR